MSTIAIDSTGLVAFDSQTTDSSSGFAFNSDQLKVREFHDFGLVGVVGNAGMVERVCGWLRSGAHERDIPSGEFLAIWLDYSSTIRLYDSDNKGLFVSPPAPYAIGSGGKYAMGAMAAGLSAFEAVAIAKRFDLYTGGDIHCINMTEIIRERNEQLKQSDTIIQGGAIGRLADVHGSGTGGVGQPWSRAWTGAE